MPLDYDPIGGRSPAMTRKGLFSRDINGQLIRLDAPTERDYEENLTIQIDGQPVTVPLAEPLKDASGNIVQTLEGSTTPALHHHLRRGHETLREGSRRREKNPHPDPLPPAAHETGRRMPPLRGASLSAKNTASAPRSENSSPHASTR